MRQGRAESQLDSSEGESGSLTPVAVPARPATAAGAKENHNGARKIRRSEPTGIQSLKDRNSPLEIAERPLALRFAESPSSWWRQPGTSVQKMGQGTSIPIRTDAADGIYRRGQETTTKLLADVGPPTKETDGTIEPRGGSGKRAAFGRLAGTAPAPQRKARGLSPWPFETHSLPQQPAHA